ncbi:TldD/PmbA family protein [Chloracidobacterium validum]|uniref:TldD/PmbA family protein n=1 Tax=Chloracidobacterium validum TaxID=2821543 RepID=A0ABX8B8B2_9BACT|nr:TldD/PmbA family protein [Chloracidobacterium validum]QUW03172.1 TldD/PmbA family protein [Chloracidobacterium validum]
MNLTPAEIAASVVERARRLGATAAEVLLRESVEFSASVRLGEVETVKEAASRGLGLRVLLDGRQASVSTSDLSPTALDELAETALALARATSVDDTAGIPDPSDLATETPDLDLYDAAILALSSDEKIRLALTAEEAARAYDARVVNFEGGGVDSGAGHTVLVNSLGFVGEYRSASLSLATVPVARDADGRLQRDYWYDTRRKVAALESPTSIGRRAAERAIRKLGARRVPTQRCPVVFAPEVAASLVGHIFGAVSGDAIFRKASFLVGKLGETIASPLVTVIDDGRLPQGLGSRPFDGEGVPTRQTVVIRAGTLESYLHNTYTARKLGERTTGNASRGLTGAPTVGANNMYLVAGPHPPEAILASVKNGFYVTELIGFGVNGVTGDYSRGAAGQWIQDGELAFPVEEVTIAGNLLTMLKQIEMVGNDLDFRGRMAAPTLKIGELMISGD